MLANFPIRELVTITILLLIGLLLFEKGILRARQLIYVYLPVALTLIMLITATWERRFSTWIAELLFSILATVSVMVVLLVIWRIKKVDVDQLDQKRGQLSRWILRRRNRREKK
jgi:hypothetical protein